MRRVIKPVLLVLVAVAFFGQPGMARYVSAQPSRDICEVASSDSDGATDRFNQKLSDINSTLSTETEEVATALNGSTQAVISQRQSRDADMERAVQAYLDNQDSPAEREEASSYATEVIAAVAARRMAYDEAAAAFTAAVQSQRSERHAFLRSAVTDYRNAVLDALDTADTGCRRFRPDKDSVRTQLTVNLRQARETFQAQVGSRQPAEDMKELIAIRDRAFETVRAVFEQAILDARAKL